MIVYKTATPRAALGVAAAAMAAVTMAVMVVIPAELEVNDSTPYVQSTATQALVVRTLPAISVLAESLDSDEAAPAGHAALDSPEPCVHPVASSVSPRNRT